MPRIAIIGAGITGVTSATSCASRLRRFRLRPPALSRDGNLLRQRRPAVGQQRRGLEQRRHRAQGSALAGRSNAPLLLNPRFSWHKYSGCCNSCARSPPPQHHRHHPAGDRGAPAPVRHGRGRRHRLRPSGAASCTSTTTPPASRPRDAATSCCAKAAWNATRSRPRRLATSSRRCKRPATPAYTPSDATGDIHKFTRGLAQACERLGVRFVQDADVAAIAADGTGYALDRRHGRRRRPAPADAVVVCAGAASRRFARQLGDTVNIYPVKGYSISVHLDDAASREAARASACSTRPPRSSPAGWATASAWPAPPSSTATTGHPRRTRAAAGGLDPPPLPRRQDGARGALVRAAPDDAGHDAARGSGQAAGRSTTPATATWAGPCRRPPRNCWRLASANGCGRTETTRTRPQPADRRSPPAVGRRRLR